MLRTGVDLSRALWLALAILPAWLSAASAVPITLYVEAAGTGFDPADVAAAEAAGEPQPLRIAGIDDGAGSFRITMRDAAPTAPGKSKREPARAASTWTLHVAPGAPSDRLHNVSLVILGSDRASRKYKPRNLGLAIDTGLPWRLVTPLGGGPTYVAYPLGDLEAGASYDIPLEYRVGQRLKKQHGELVMPRYAVGFAAVPEPSAGLLGAVAVAWLGRRRRFGNRARA